MKSIFNFIHLYEHKQANEHIPVNTSQRVCNFYNRGKETSPTYQNNSSSTELTWITFWTYLDFDLDLECDSECLEALDGLRDPDLLSDFTRAGLPAGDFDWERDS